VERVDAPDVAAVREFGFEHGIELCTQRIEPATHGLASVAATWL